MRKPRVLDGITDPRPSPGMIPPDLSRCQANPNVLRWSPFSLGPMPKPVRCTSPAEFIAEEVLPGKDGLFGSMSLCSECVTLLQAEPSVARRVSLTRISAPGAKKV